MYHDPQTSPDRISKRLRCLATDGAALYDRAERGEPMGERDLALAIDLIQQYVDVLSDMEDMEFEIYEVAAVEVML